VTSTLAARPIETRLRPLYATGFIHGFALWYAVEKLFMKSIGFNDFLITIATITYIVVMTTANIPWACSLTGGAARACSIWRAAH